LEKIGEGGMGIVYKAHHALLRRETALKLLPPDKSDAASIELFEREVRLTCRLTHPNTIQVYDYGHTPDGIFYYAMEFLDGLNLHDLVARYGAQPEERVAHILSQVCESLREAHGLGLIHRDIKPANVFLCDRGGVADTVKVLDFGLVKHFAESTGETPTAQFLPADGIIGTPNFLAPEAIRDHLASDARSDLYALGALGYFLLTGKYVFESESVAEVCRKHLTEVPTPPSVRAGKPLNVELEALILRCLDKEPLERPQSAGELLEKLRTIPLADSWSGERRTAWWANHRAAVTAASNVAMVTPTPSPLDETVRIEFADRTH
ncbi:MAG: serine/threonine protein kinase, partial [Verrucomicrobia bacterium]